MPIRLKLILFLYCLTRLFNRLFFLVFSDLNILNALKKRNQNQNQRQKLIFFTLNLYPLFDW